LGDNSKATRELVLEMSVSADGFVARPAKCRKISIFF